jgi:hypothetical protein
MTEAEWLAGEDAEAMWRFLKAGASGRKLRLLACACVSNLLPLAKIVPDQARAGLEEVVRYADGMSTRAAMKRVRERMAEARASTPSHRTTADDFVCYAVEYAAQEKGALKAVDYSAGIWGWGSREFVPLPHAALFLEIFGNPFRPVSFPPEWRTSTALALSRQMYESRDFGPMPILADALQDAGCDNANVLCHCRETGPHVRGCWVVDWVLNKE